MLYTFTILKSDLRQARNIHNLWVETKNLNLVGVTAEAIALERELNLPIRTFWHTLGISTNKSRVEVPLPNEHGNDLLNWSHYYAFHGYNLAIKKAPYKFTIDIPKEWIKYCEE